MNIFRKYTWKVLGKNKTRTLVTIIGILLSAAMITAVTTSISSLQKFMLNLTVDQEGSWHGVYFNMQPADQEELKGLAEVENCVTVENIGYAQLENSKNEYKPYLFLGGMPENMTELLPIHLTEGRLPENSGEIMLPEHLYDNGRVEYALGQTLTLEIGDRYGADGQLLSQHDSYAGDEEREETFSPRETREFTVVGFYERPGFEWHSAPGYTALTVSENAAGAAGDLYFTLENPRETQAFLSQHFAEKYLSSYNRDFLTYSGYSSNDSFNAVLYGLAAILIGIIMFGSISLIYNSFSISVNERIKQFGLLSSIGATKKQLLKTVLFESVTLSAIGIPLGVLAGLFGIGVTFKLTEGMFSSLLAVYSTVKLGLSATWEAIVLAAAVGFVTVLISAYLPARRALRVSAIDAIRQTNEVNINPKKVKTSKLTLKLFGFEGMLASKNFKRNKRKYRATVFSLFMSIVLFISASSFCSYLKNGVESIILTYAYDISYNVPSDLGDVSNDALYFQLANTEGITEGSYVYIQSNNVFSMKSDHFTKEYLDYLRGLDSYTEQNGNMLQYGLVYFVKDDIYEKYLRENGYDAAVYMDAENPTALAVDYMKIYDYNEERYKTFQMLQDTNFTVELATAKEEYLFTGRIETESDGTCLVGVLPQGGSGAEEEVLVPLEEAYSLQEVQVGEVAQKLPLGVETVYGDCMTLLFPCSAIQTLCGEEALNANFFFRSSNPNQTYEAMGKTLDDLGLDTSGLTNVADNIQSQRAIITIINVFSYGFIVLISLIAAANVFNTISTNIHLRRREFAMLRSVGMTQKGFHKMMNYECLLYGLKGLLYGIPVSVGVTYFIYRAVSEGWDTGFYIPWYSLAISIGSVFLVVFATMLYAMSKIKKDNTIDALKNENL